MTEFKGLTGGLNRQVSGERRATFSGSAGRLVRSEAYLLILKWLSAKLPGGTGEDLLNLKDLLTVFPRSLRHLFEIKPVWRPLISCRIAPNPANFRQKRADNGRKVRVFATDFVRFSVVVPLAAPFPWSSEVLPKGQGWRTLAGC